MDLFKAERLGSSCFKQDSLMIRAIPEPTFLSCRIVLFPQQDQCRIEKGRRQQRMLLLRIAVGATIALEASRTQLTR